MLADLQVRQNDKLFTFGFSQGGHSALALHRELQDARVDVTATATVGGVFDVEQWFLASLANETTAHVPLYVSYLLLAYDDIYDIYGQTAETSSGAVRLDGRAASSTCGTTSTTSPPGYRRPRASSDAVLLRRADHATARLHSASACARTPWIGGRPEAPVRVYHSPDDEEVPYDDALVSVNGLRRRGGDVTVRPLPGFDHVNSWIQAMPRAVRWFRDIGMR